MERRPIASRNTRWANAGAAFLARTGIRPNDISLLGVVAAALAAVCFVQTGRTTAPPIAWWIAGALLVQIRLLANLFDGMVAQIQNSSSPVGELYNEVPDRISDVAILTGFGFAIGSSPFLGLAASILAVFIAYVRAQLATTGVPQQYVGPMAKAQRMAAITVAAFVAPFVSSFPIATYALWVIIAGSIVTAVRRLIKGACYLNSRASENSEE